mmetsp:Transcript_24546/g.49869  ORF Transcript_24546/g.49869 Transcript_24546/m.49869 type:complete len:80 (+) Transcript_24546:59-298(+)
MHAMLLIGAKRFPRTLTSTPVRPVGVEAPEDSKNSQEDEPVQACAGRRRRGGRVQHLRSAPREAEVHVRSWGELGCTGP